VAVITAAIMAIRVLPSTDLSAIRIGPTAIAATGVRPFVADTEETAAVFADVQAADSAVTVLVSAAMAVGSAVLAAEAGKAVEAVDANSVGA
jgi:hypothetical protein